MVKIPITLCPCKDHLANVISVAIQLAFAAGFCNSAEAELINAINEELNYWNAAVNSVTMEMT